MSQPLVPLVDLIKGNTKREIQNLMIEVMPILFVPSLNKRQLIDELIDYVRASGSVDQVCRLALKGFRKDYLHMILRQYDLKAAKTMRKSAMIDHFISLNMPRECENFRDDAQLVDVDDMTRKRKKTKKKIIKNC